MVCKDVASGMTGGEKNRENKKNKGSALLLTLVIAAAWSVFSLMLLISGTVQMRVQRRMLMQENNFCYLEEAVEMLLPELETLTENIAKECRAKALREAAKAARDDQKAEEAEIGSETTEIEIDMELAQKLYEERFFYKIKRSFRPKELEKRLGEEIQVSVTAGAFNQEGDTIQIKGLRFSGSAPDSQIRSSVSADFRILLPELISEEMEEGNSSKENSVSLEHLYRGKRKIRNRTGQ